MAAPEAKRDVHSFGQHVEISACRDDSPIVCYDERTVEQRKLFERSAKSRVLDVSGMRDVSLEWIQDKRSRMLQHAFGMTHREKRP